MPSKLLDPTLDVTFKLLMTSNEALLLDMIGAVVQLPAPIDAIEVLNPEIPKTFPGDKTIRLDIRVRLADGSQVDLEMQCELPEGVRARFLYYWARGFSDSLNHGEDYEKLRPCISILWFKKPLLKAEQFHSTFVVADLDSREILSPMLEIHALELSKLHLAPKASQAKLERWARFLRATTVEELETLAAEDPMMSTAKKTLEELSQDPDAQRMARDREADLCMHRHLLACARDAGQEEGRAEGLAEGETKGRAEGRVEGRVEGRAEGFRSTLLRLLSKRFGPLPPWAEERVMAAEMEQLEVYLDAVIDAGSLEAVLNANQ